MICHFVTCHIVYAKSSLICCNPERVASQTGGTWWLYSTLQDFSFTFSAVDLFVTHFPFHVSFWEIFKCLLSIKILCENSIIIGDFLKQTSFVFIRFVDISVDVRVECIKRAKEFLQHHPVLASDLAGRCCIKYIEKIWSDSPNTCPLILSTYLHITFSSLRTRLW